PGGRQTHIVAAGLTVPYRDPLRYAVVLVGTALGGGMSSRLFQRVREERGLAYSVYTFHSFFAAGGHAGAYLGTSPETADEARDVLLREMHDVATAGPTADELEETRKQMKGHLTLSLESPGARMNRLAGLALYDEPYRTLDEIARQIDAIDEEAARAAASLLHPDRLAVLELSPD
ncbi:MAG: M16 family metallopeptidase, partial [Gemmatimonadota bacterium]